MKIPPAPSPSPLRPRSGNNPLEGVPGYSTAPADGCATRCRPRFAKRCRAATTSTSRPGRRSHKTDKKPIIIRVVGNQLIFESKDTEALDLIMEFAQAFFAMAGKPAGEPVQGPQAQERGGRRRGQTISEIFNGPQQQQRQGGVAAALGGLLGGGGGGLLGGLLGGGGAPAAPAGVNPNRVRVVAETGSNSLVVVKASRSTC